MKLVVTGSSGFVGRALTASLRAAGHTVVGTGRTRQEGGDVAVGEIGPDTDWSAALAGADGVIHLAARVHVMHDTASDPLAAFRAVNTLGSIALARQAAAAGVKRLVFLSSVKVSGEGGAFTDAETSDPQDPYGVSKAEAEEGLRRVAAETGLEVVILRPPLIYGPGVKANFQRLMQTVERGVPLPLGAIDNRRSLLYVGNLVDAIALCMSHPAAAGRSYLVSDGDPVSTPALIREIAAALDRPARLLPVPPGLIRLAGRLLGKEKEVSRLLGSLTLDNGALKQDLGWRPPFTLRQGLAETARKWATAAR